MLAAAKAEGAPGGGDIWCAAAAAAAASEGCDVADPYKSLSCEAIDADAEGGIGIGATTGGTLSRWHLWQRSLSDSWQGPWQDRQTFDIVICDVIGVRSVFILFGCS